MLLFVFSEIEAEKSTKFWSENIKCSAVGKKVEIMECYDTHFRGAVFFALYYYCLEFNGLTKEGGKKGANNYCKERKITAWYKTFFYPLLWVNIFFDILLWSSFQSSLDTYYILQIMMDLLCGQLYFKSALINPRNSISLIF